MKIQKQTSSFGILKTKKNRGYIYRTHKKRKKKFLALNKTEKIETMEQKNQKDLILKEIEKRKQSNKKRPKLDFFFLNVFLNEQRFFKKILEKNEETNIFWNLKNREI
jgi:hypothetical protein